MKIQTNSIGNTSNTITRLSTVRLYRNQSGGRRATGDQIYCYLFVN